MAVDMNINWLELDKLDPEFAADVDILTILLKPRVVADYARNPKKQMGKLTAENIEKGARTSATWYLITGAVSMNAIREEHKKRKEAMSRGEIYEFMDVIETTLKSLENFGL